MEFSDKVVLVTGGTRGIGRAISSKFAREGANLVVNFRDDWDAAKNMAAKLSISSKRLMLVKADVRSYKQMKKVIDRVIGKFGKLDILINNAAAHSPGRRVVDLTPEDWRRVIDVNLNGVFNVTRLALKEMIEKREGCIINISSSMGRCPMINSAPYSCSKAALEVFTRVVAKEVGQFRIRINAVAPGLISSQQAQLFLEDTKKANFVDSIPLGRLGCPEEVAEVVIFLASKRSSYITGEVIYVKGGDRLTVSELSEGKTH